LGGVFGTFVITEQPGDATEKFLPRESRDRADPETDAERMISVI
jgi:hypothetical protein